MKHPNDPLPIPLSSDFTSEANRLFFLKRLIEEAKKEAEAIKERARLDPAAIGHCDEGEWFLSRPSPKLCFKKGVTHQTVASEVGEDLASRFYEYRIMTPSVLFRARKRRGRR